MEYDLDAMNRALREMHYKMGDIRRWQGVAMLSEDLVQWEALERELRDLMFDAKELQDKIDGLSSSETKL